ncbi:hypothetical protein ACIRYZ_46000 [Kitasatospora sp. NPDC101155]|uniref:hypothetical protein n=1 Tax=Kitasatospora sp. NPDC101155 TaxID=3364097 RepID=UPI0038264D12
MGEGPDARRIIDHYFAEQETAARTEAGLGGGDVRDVRAQRERFARTGRLSADDIMRLRMWAINRTASALARQPRSAAAIDEAIRSYRLVVRWADEQPPPACEYS